MILTEKQMLLRAKRLISLLHRCVINGDKDDRIQLALYFNQELDNTEYNFIIELWKNNIKKHVCKRLIRRETYLSEEEVYLYSKKIYDEFVKKININETGFFDMPEIFQISFGVNKKSEDIEGSLIQFYSANIKPSNFIETNGKCRMLIRSDI